MVSRHTNSDMDWKDEKDDKMLSNTLDTIHVLDSHFVTFAIMKTLIKMNGFVYKFQWQSSTAFQYHHYNWRLHQYLP